MNVQLRASLHEAMAQMLRKRGEDVTEVTGFEQYTYIGGYCDTCGYTELRVKITYTTRAGATEEYDFYGDLGELIRALTDE